MATLPSCNGPCSRVLCPFEHPSASPKSNPAYTSLCTSFHGGIGVITTDELDPTWTAAHGGYPPNANCSWTIYGNPGVTPLRLRFDDVELEASHDWMKVYDGECAEAASRIPIRMYSCDSISPDEPCYSRANGHELLEDAVSPSGVMTIAFVSDGSMERRGFNMTFWTDDQLVHFASLQHDTVADTVVPVALTAIADTPELEVQAGAFSASVDSDSSSPLIAIIIAVCSIIGVAAAVVALAYHVKKGKTGPSRRSFDGVDHSSFEATTVQELATRERVRKGGGPHFAAPGKANLVDPFCGTSAKDDCGSPSKTRRGDYPPRL